MTGGTGDIMAQHISIRVPWHDDGWKGIRYN